MSDPIFNDDPLFGSNLLKTSCPSRSDICGNLLNKPRKGVLATSTYISPPTCNDTHFSNDIDKSENGCCVAAANMTCDNYLTDEIKNSTNFKGSDYDIGIDFYDAIDVSGKKICHSTPLRKRVVNITEFIYTILISTGVILLTAYVGSCYEYWFKYGTGGIDNECFKFENNCGVKISPIDYAFPDKRDEYPYNYCDPKSESSDEFFLYFLKIGVAESNPIEDDDDIFFTRISKAFDAFGKSFALNFFYTVLFSRKSLNSILKRLSLSYKDWSQPFKNFIFLFISGIGFYLIATFTNNPQINSGIIFVFYGLALVVIFTTLCAFFLTNTSLAWTPDAYNTKFFPDEATTKLPDHYALVNKNIFYKMRGIGGPFNHITVERAFKNLMIFIVLFCVLSISSVFGFVGALVGLCYMIIDLIFSIFIRPWFYKKECCFTIIKDHSELLILLFCFSIVLSAIQNLNSTSTGLISAIVGVIILYKLVKNIK